MFKNKKILVTGGSGFIGANLIRRLILEDAEIYALVRESSNFWRLNDVLEKIRFRVGDLSDSGGLKQIVQEVKPDGVFHLGATTIIQGVIAESEKVTAVNVDGTKNLLEALEGFDYNFFINTGTFSDTEGTDDYAKSKLLATKFVSEFGKNTGKPVVILRLFAPYGPFVQRGRLMHAVLTGAMKGEEVKMSSQEITRDFIFVDDLTDLYFAAARYAKKYPGEIFDAGSGISTTLKEVADNALRITGSKNAIVWGSLQKLSYDSDEVRADIEKTTLCLDWKPKTTLLEGMQKTYDWLKENLHYYS